MASLRAILLSLGTTGAEANALSALQQRERDSRAVARLEARFGAAVNPSAATVAVAA